MRKRLNQIAKYTVRIFFITFLIPVLTFFAASCGYEREKIAEPDPAQDPAGEPGEGGGKESPAPVDYAELGVNELGEIMVLMYHQIGEPEEEWVRTPDNFRQDLQLLYAAGYRAVSLSDVLDRNIDLPAGTSPVVFTFDDGAGGQFRYIEKDGELIIDPDCAVGILEAFHQENPDFGLAATFYIFYSGTPFGQPEHVQRKLTHLAERGFEIGNHTNSHPNLRRLSPEEATEEIALMVKNTWQHLPGYRVRSLALPYGGHPDEMSHIIRGSHDGVSYHNEAILLVGSNPAPSPFSSSFNPSRIPRIRAGEMKTDGVGIYEWMKVLENTPGRRYISDGDPGTLVVPAAMKEKINEAVLQGLELIIY